MNQNQSLEVIQENNSEFSNSIQTHKNKRKYNAAFKSFDKKEHVHRFHSARATPLSKRYEPENCYQQENFKNMKVQQYPLKSERFPYKKQFATIQNDSTELYKYKIPDISSNFDEPSHRPKRVDPSQFFPNQTDDSQSFVLDSDDDDLQCEKEIEEESKDEHSSFLKQNENTKQNNFYFSSNTNENGTIGKSFCQNNIMDALACGIITQDDFLRQCCTINNFEQKEETK